MSMGINAVARARKILEEAKPGSRESEDARAFLLSHRRQPEVFDAGFVVDDDEEEPSGPFTDEEEDEDEEDEDSPSEPEEDPDFVPANEHSQKRLNLVDDLYAVPKSKRKEPATKSKKLEPVVKLKKVDLYTEQKRRREARENAADAKKVDAASKKELDAARRNPLSLFYTGPEEKTVKAAAAANKRKMAEKEKSPAEKRGRVKSVPPSAVPVPSSALVPVARTTIPPASSSSSAPEHEAYVPSSSYKGPISLNFAPEGERSDDPSGQNIVHWEGQLGQGFWLKLQTWRKNGQAYVCIRKNQTTGQTCRLNIFNRCCSLQYPATKIDTTLIILPGSHKSFQN
ncbi:nucleolin-like [Folsomia candida]|uniref:nucleolin-like n=1 Tax=Folsomia candida TaxID=158441 RepID=UPI0016054432|nr:nucleolin-like [Folsomia candida]